MNESIALTEAVYYILLSLCSPLHGYGIMQRVEEMSAGRVKLAAGTLYGALNILKERGWITLESVTDGRRKDYAIAEKGRQVLMAELARLKELVQNGEKYWRVNDYGNQNGYINLLCAVVMAYGLGRVYGKKEAFERERRIRE